MVAAAAALDALSARWLLLDLEVSNRGKPLKIGAVLRNRTFARSGNFSLEFSLAELGDLAGAADAVLGHNLVRHDLSVLRGLDPRGIRY